MQKRFLPTQKIELQVFQEMIRIYIILLCILNSKQALEKRSSLGFKDSTVLKSSIFRKSFEDSKMNNKTAIKEINSFAFERDEKVKDKNVPCLNVSNFNCGDLDLSDLC